MFSRIFLHNVLKLLFVYDYLKVCITGRNSLLERKHCHKVIIKVVITILQLYI